MKALAPKGWGQGEGWGEDGVVLLVSTRCLSFVLSPSLALRWLDL